MAVLCVVAAAVMLAFVSCSTEASRPVGSAVAPNPPWLAELNRLRAIGGLRPVSDDPQLSRDCYAHAKYLIDSGPADPAQFVNYRTMLGLGAHHENPDSKYYSEAGVNCAQGANLEPGFAHSNDVAWGPDATKDMDGLFYDAPFHRLSLLAAWASTAGFGEYGTWPRRVGVLALRGEGWVGSPLIRFPTDNSTVIVGSVSTFEVPNPLTSCPGYRLPVGLPITIQLGSGYRGRLASYSIKGPSGAIETCGFDWNTYQNPNAGVREAARKELRMFGGMILIPRSPLADGRYSVSVDTKRQRLEWTFAVATQPRPAMTALRGH